MVVLTVVVCSTAVNQTRCQKYDFFYSKFSAELNEFSSRNRKWLKNFESHRVLEKCSYKSLTVKGLEVIQKDRETAK